MNGNPSRVNIKQLCCRIRRWRYNLIPAESRFKTSCLIKKDIFKMKVLHLFQIFLFSNVNSINTDLTSPKAINPLSGSTTSSCLDHFLEEFADGLALITFPSGNDDLPFDIDSDLREINYLLNHDPTKEIDSILEGSVDESNLADPNNYLCDIILDMFIDEHTLDYSSPLLYDDFDDDLFKLESDNADVYDNPFDSKEDKIKESKLLIDELDPLDKMISFLPPSITHFSLRIFQRLMLCLQLIMRTTYLIRAYSFMSTFLKVTIRVTPDRNVKKISISHAFLILEGFNLPLYELPFHKEVPWSKTLLSFSSENEEKVFKPGILTSKGFQNSLLLELSHRGPKAFKVIKIFESPMKIFLALMEMTSVS
nr:hypothetical protein [Tanacetum cinerariifolium]